MSARDLNRPQLKTSVYLDVAYALSRLSTCDRRQVGCVLLDVHGRPVGMGYNGVARGMPHCRSSLTHKCPGANAVSGSELENCYAIHAEMNALAMCERPFELHAAYITTSPCIHCVKLFMNTSLTDIWFRNEYPHSAAKELWLAASNRRWHHA